LAAVEAHRQAATGVSRQARLKSVDNFSEHHVSIQQQQLSQARYIDSVQLAELFADSLHAMVWEGNTLRIEFCVTRFPDAALIRGKGAGTAPRLQACSDRAGGCGSFQPASEDNERAGEADSSRATTGPSHGPLRLLLR
jgi:hypothetical protein